MKFYSTQNESVYGGNWPKFEPRLGRHVGTGYLSNFRPGVYYSPRLDSLDNPGMKPTISRNYSTVTQRHFRPHSYLDGTDRLPSEVRLMESGFIRQKPFSTNGEKFGCMTTESQQSFRGIPRRRLDLSGKAIGHINEESGFTHAHNIEPITYQFGSSYGSRVSEFPHAGRNSLSVMKSSFVPHWPVHDGKRIPDMNKRATRETGFTGGTTTTTVYESMKPEQDSNTPSAENSVLHRIKYGSKEASGFVENHDRFVSKPDDNRRFITHYSTRFYPKAPFTIRADPSSLVRGIRNHEHINDNLQRYDDKIGSNTHRLPITMVS